MLKIKKNGETIPKMAKIKNPEDELMVAYDGWVKNLQGTLKNHKIWKCRLQRLLAVWLKGF